VVDRSEVHTMGVDSTSGQNQPVWTDVTPHVPVTSTDGKLMGLIQARDTLVQERTDDLNALAKRLIESVNSVHSAGVGLDGVSGRAFFSGTDANDDRREFTIDRSRWAIDGRSRAHAAGDSARHGLHLGKRRWSNAIALAQIQQAVAQRDTSQPGMAVTTLRRTTDHRRSSGWTCPCFSQCDHHHERHGRLATHSYLHAGLDTTTATLSVGTDSSGNQVITADGGSLGIRVTVTAACPPLP